MSGRLVMAPASVGLIGKLPAHGDFVRRGGDAAVLGQVDGWLAGQLAQLDPDALDARLANLKSWRFLCVGKNETTIGAMIASSDSVGRVFPAIGFAVLTEEVSFGSADSWCTAAADLLEAGRDTGETADHAHAGLTSIRVVPIDGEDAPIDDIGMMWWRDGIVPIVTGAWPVEATFGRLLDDGETAA